MQRGRKPAVKREAGRTEEDVADVYLQKKAADL